MILSAAEGRPRRAIFPFLAKQTASDERY